MRRDTKITAGEFALCAGDKSYPWRTRKWFTGDKNSKIPKKSKIQKKVKKI
jgi:hypothetical protein